MFRQFYQRTGSTRRLLWRHRVAVLLLFLLALVASLYSSILLQPFHSSNYNPLHRIENYQAGRWRPREVPVKTKEDLDALYPGVAFREVDCDGGFERMYQIMSWEWVGADGKNTTWDARGFVVDALRGGLLLVGDSITHMHLSGLDTLLNGLVYQTRIDYNTKESLIQRTRTADETSLHIRLDLNPKHPATEGLLEEAGVGKDRLDHPLVTLIRNDYMGSTRAELDRACAEHDAAFDYRHKVYLADWLKVASELAARPSENKLVVVVNSGLHFGMSPLTDPKPPQETLLGVYRSIIRNAFEAASNLTNVRMVVRTSFPGQSDCRNYTVPFEDPSMATMEKYGWWQVPDMNSIVRDAMPLFGDVPALLMDVERQAMMRPDARLRPEKDRDCLHTCPGALGEDWGRWLGMVMKQEEGWGF